MRDKHDPTQPSHKDQKEHRPLDSSFSIGTVPSRIKREHLIRTLQFSVLRKNLAEKLTKKLDDFLGVGQRNAEKFGDPF